VLKPIVIKSGKVKTKTPAPALAYSSPVAVQTTGTTAEWALRKARYAEGLYDLRHISKRPAFLAFFGQSDGECWIVTD